MTEHDPTAIDPDEAEQPSKPAIKDMPPPEGEAPPTDQEEFDAEGDIEFLDPKTARDDPTIDDTEHPDAKEDS